MKKLYLSMLTLSLVAIGAQTTTETVKHTIKSGETLYIIAHKNHTTIEEVRKENDLKRGDVLKIGRVLKVPQNTYFPDKKKTVVKIIKKNENKKLAKKINQKTNTEKSVKSTTYVIERGDTLSGIAHKNRTTMAEVKKANNLKKGETLKIGRVLTVPKDTYFPDKNKKSKNLATKTVKHTIESGETLFTIARKNRTTIEEVKKANNLKKGETLKIGRVLRVPQNTYFPDKNKKVAKVIKKNESKKLAIKTDQKANIKKTAKTTRYVIERGDTLSGIAHKYHITIADVRKANGFKRGDTLKFGKVLEIPKNSYAQSAKKKNFKTAKINKSRENQKLAKALMNIKSKNIAKPKTKKDQKFSLGDIFFKGKPKSDEKLKSKSAKITKLAKGELGKKYVWGAVGKKDTYDCSGLTTYVCKKNGIRIPRRAIAQSKYGKSVSRSNLKPGDLIFFDTSKKRKGYVNHVGIYIGNNKFIHASSAKKKVVITSLSKNFYSQRYKGARRVTS